MLARMPRRLPALRTVALALVAVWAGAVAFLAVAVLEILPVPRGMTPWQALGVRWTLQDMAVFGGFWTLAGLALGGWKAIAVAAGRPTSRTSALVWLALFAAFTGWAVVTAVRTVETFGWPP